MTMKNRQKENQYDDEGHLKNMDVWDWVVTKGGKIRQITNDDMNDLHYSEITRFANNDEIIRAKSNNPERDLMERLLGVPIFESEFKFIPKTPTEKRCWDKEKHNLIRTISMSRKNGNK